MAKDQRTIHSGIVHDGTTYLAGQEDELEKALSKEQITRLTKQGAISGFDAKADKAAASEAETGETAAETTEPAGKGKKQ